MYKIYLRLLFFLIVRSLSAGAIAITFEDALLLGSELMNGKEKTMAIISHLKQHEVESATFFLQCKI